ncbi:hypothetical protein ACFY8W_01905 [Streptomyces sp. NPDC012637]|uniref:hypothetical protein n=1 Tax=Streptomyces sp. NPDC012637 TaxID=3364842 RepID=UPI0036E8AFC1
MWHTGATPGYSAVLFLLPESNLALVLQQNLHGLLHDGAVTQAGFGAARILAGGTAPTDAPSAAVYHATIWGLTVLALGLLLQAFHSVRLLRRPAPLRTTPTALWSLAGTLPAVLLTTALALVGPRALWMWTPDAFAALCGATVAGAAVTALRVALACTRGQRNAPDGGRRGEPGPAGGAHHRP